MEPWHYIALLGAVVAVGALSMPRNRAANQPVQSVQNMETALEQFMENMERDNDDLLKLVAKSQADAKAEGERKDSRIAALEQRCETLDNQLTVTLDKLAQTAATPVSHVNSDAGKELDSRTISLGTSTAARPECNLTIEEIERPSSVETAQSNTIVSRYSELFYLYEQGKSIEAIAKKLGMNKGEVQLIIGLAKQEGAAHV
ncbi:DUF6115 domain-containing protein [Paenibacillus sp. strain BS8-2]